MSTGRVPPPKVSRRTACKAGIAAALFVVGQELASAAGTVVKSKTRGSSQSMNSRPHVAVIGAGAFGGWAALYLLRCGARVTLVDTWGPGNSRASSGGETRVIRGAYGPDQPYTKLAARALELWKENQSKWNQQFFFPIGVLWMVEGSGEFERGSLPMLKDAGIPFEQLSVGDMTRRWPQVSFDKIEWGIYERESGYLLARVSAQAVVNRFIAEGGEYRQAAVAASRLEGFLTLRRIESRCGPLCFCLRPMAGQIVPRHRGTTFCRHETRRIFLWNSCGRRTLQRRQHPGMGRSQRSLHVRNSRQSGTRL